MAATWPGLCIQSFRLVTCENSLGRVKGYVTWMGAAPCHVARLRRNYSTQFFSSAPRHWPKVGWVLFCRPPSTPLRLARRLPAMPLKGGWVPGGGFFPAACAFARAPRRQALVAYGHVQHWQRALGVARKLHPGLRAGRGAVLAGWLVKKCGAFGLLFCVFHLLPFLLVRNSCLQGSCPMQTRRCLRFWPFVSVLFSRHDMVLPMSATSAMTAMPHILYLCGLWA